MRGGQLIESLQHSMGGIDGCVVGDGRGGGGDSSGGNNVDGEEGSGNSLRHSLQYEVSMLAMQEHASQEKRRQWRQWWRQQLRHLSRIWGFNTSYASKKEYNMLNEKKASEKIELCSTQCRFISVWRWILLISSVFSFAWWGTIVVVVVGLVATGMAGDLEVMGIEMAKAVKAVPHQCPWSSSSPRTVLAFP
jgi:hypothetical protein